MEGNRNDPLRALVFDEEADAYVQVIDRCAWADDVLEAQAGLGAVERSSLRGQGEIQRAFQAAPELILAPYPSGQR
jgi:hypothetical protein